MNKGGFVTFLTVVLSIWAVIHAFVFWRLAAVSWINSHLSARSLALIALVGWISYPVSRILHARQMDVVANPLEFAATTWVGILFLLFAALVVTETITLGGWLFPSIAPRLRDAGVACALVCAGFALVQGFRPPVLREYTVEINGLRPEHDGLVIVQLSDLHLGTMLGRSWLERIVARTTELQPDLVVVTGDLIDGNVDRVKPLEPILRELRAPLGVWAVTGNHEIYAGYQDSVRLLESVGYRVLCDRWLPAAPGLVIAGVDDLTARGRLGLVADPIGTTLADCPADAATILLSHSPLEIDRAETAGVALLLSGHTHAGQIWPFGYLVGLRYPLVGGRYQVGNMTAIVCRGTGTWGPRMRLWRPCEFNRITLRRADPG